ncbi:MAG: PHB depolymerase family esterase [Oscillatoria sp. PMC 1068.18]|nr:PHB depolymerase family esterase [Oscillatoria sp. PMC 1076.18]MEC4988879.1 PHB depolymerase family esterase [Oscillatoria sp. PMC 1068.18]
MKSLDAISFPPKSGNQPQGLFVVLHGWGANSQDLANLAPFLELPDYQFVFPNATFPHNHVPEGRQWYNLEDQDFAGLTESREVLTHWLKSLATSTGIPLSQTVLAGFSQGGAMTLDVGMSLPLAAMCSFSGYLHGTLEKPQTPRPVLIVHGRQDQVVPLRAAHQIRDELTKLDVNVDYHEFDMGHEIRPEVLSLIQSFMKSNLLSI